MEMPQVERCLPDGGCRNLWLHLSIASLNTLISCTDPGHPASTNVNLMSKSQQAMTFCVVMFFAAHVLDRQIFVNNDRYMSAIYCSNTIVKEGRESRILQSMMGLTETWVPWCDDVCS